MSTRSPLRDAERLQAVGEPADAVIELPVGDLRHRAVVGLEDDRDLFGVAVREVAVEAVVRDVELAVVEPLVERRVRLVERLRERLVPQQLVARELRPEAGEIARPRSAFSASKSAFLTLACATNARGGSNMRVSVDTDSIVDMLRSPPGRRRPRAPGPAGIDATASQSNQQRARPTQRAALTQRKDGAAAIVDRRLATPAVRWPSPNAVRWRPPRSGC